MSTRKYNAISSFEMKGSNRDHSGQSIDEYQLHRVGNDHQKPIRTLDKSQLYLHYKFLLTEIQSTLQKLT